MILWLLERIGVCLLVVLSCLLFLLVIGGSVSVILWIFGFLVLLFFFDRIFDRNIGVLGNLFYKKRILEIEKFLLFNNLYIVRNYDLLFWSFYYEVNN